MGPGGKVKTISEIIPDLAPAATLFASIVGLNSATGSLEKTKATFSLRSGMRFFNLVFTSPP